MGGPISSTRAATRFGLGRLLGTATLAGAFVNNAPNGANLLRRHLDLMLSPPVRLNGSNHLSLGPTGHPAAATSNLHQHGAKSLPQRRRQARAISRTATNALGFDSLVAPQHRPRFEAAETFL